MSPWLIDGVELEAEVDHLRAVVDRVADPLGDRRRVAGAVGVEHPHGHDRRAVGEAGQPEPVVGRLGDGPGHERAVALAVERERVVGRRSRSGSTNLVLAKSGRLAELVPVAVGDAGVEDRHDDAAAAGAVVGPQVRPGLRAR